MVLGAPYFEHDQAELDSAFVELKRCYNAARAGSIRVRKSAIVAVEAVGNESDTDYDCLVTLSTGEVLNVEQGDEWLIEILEDWESRHDSGR